MPEYRRFIAYIYDYYQGKKGSNRGYVKVEIRGGVCRIGLHVQPMGKVGADPLQVAAFVRQGERLRSIPMGTAVPKGNAWEYQGSTPANAFFGSSYGAGEIRGLRMTCGADNYITVWDDGPALPEMFAREESPAQAAARGETGTENREKQEAARETEESPAQAVARKEAETEAAGKKAAELSSMPGQGSDVQAAGAGGVSEQREAREQDVKVSDRPGAAQALALRWDQFLWHYPRIAPFADDEITQALSIAPKDIAFLSRTERLFCQSPFVQRAYARYHHLLLGQHRDGGFILGVPGECMSMQDRHFARMYGFPYFKAVHARQTPGGGEDAACFPGGDAVLPADHPAEALELSAANVESDLQKQNDGTFGYWYHFLE